ncbi:response regulator [Aestuariibacter halophilus]|uniref:Response regulator n=1 Tax=Fluctibacter halophilus TaxID=226011 RepID=A0ABS8G9T5_9ALTE|nr:response regulator [Aestuariibacter halophilus]MCC2617273.1 response regulator [Aestuariibacter halophilus]
MLSGKVLVIDDEPITLEMVKHILEDIVSGELLLMSSSIEAMACVQTCRDGDLDLVVCDWEMPDHTGLDILKALRAESPDTPFLMMTGHASRQYVLAAMQAGVTGFIAKPFKQQDLVARVRECISPAA